MKKIIILSIIISVYTLSQPAPPVAWLKTHNGNNLYDEITAMKVDEAGNVYVTGRCFINGSEDYCTIKYNANGIQQWIAYYNGTANKSDRPVSLDADAQGNVYVTGFGNYDAGDPFNTGDYCTIKYNSGGVQEWVQIYTAPANKRDYAYKVTLDINGNIYVTGACWFDTGRQDDIVTIKYNSAGQVLWTALHNGTHGQNPSDRGSDIVIDGQGNVYVFGMSTLSTTYTDYCLVKYNSTGVLQYTKYYAGPVVNGIDNGTAMCMDNSGNIIVTGTSEGSGTSTDIVTIKYSPAGLEQWTKRFSNPGLDNAADITSDMNGSVYVSGNKSGKGLIIKYDPIGNLMWEKEITGTGGNETINNLLIDAMGDVYGTGKASSGSYFDFVTVKINPAGTVQWKASHNGSGNLNDFGNAIGIDASGNIYVSGSSVESWQNGNFCTIKYAPGTIGISQVSGIIPDNFSLSQNYPNPFNPATKIRFSIANLPFGEGPVRKDSFGGVGSRTKLIIYDILGRQVETLVNEQIKPGTYEVDWNAVNYPSGVYFYKITVNGFSETKKMILVK
ncbi:MAG TPA: SBBP repeat-containing protein [Ignavibacteria bacterium]|nr:SBBP repeat-containing protein [Ignavibacteria bacterium]